MDEITKLRLKISELEENKNTKLLEKEENENDINYNLEIVSKIITNRNKEINGNPSNKQDQLTRYYRWKNGYGDYKLRKGFYSHDNIQFNESQLLYCLTKLYNIVNVLHKQLIIIKETNV
jgi:hypothetical protein